MYIRDKKAYDDCLPQIKNDILSLLFCGKSVDVEIKEHKHKRTLEQNNYYWLFNQQVANLFNSAGCKYNELRYTADLVHEIQKQLFGIKTTTTMSIGEFCDYITELDAYWKEKTNNEFQMPEKPEKYLERKGYTSDYMHGG